MMSRWRIGLLMILMSLPVIFLAGVGMYHLWDREWLFIAWWPMMAMVTIGLFLAWYWQRRNRLISIPVEIPHFWTDREKEAWKLIEARLETAGNIQTDQLMEFQHYCDTAQAMALEVAQFYHPNSSDVYGHLTIPEILSVGELAASDLGKIVSQYVPGSHLLTINHMKKAKEAFDWYQSAMPIWWGVSAILNPVETAARYAGSQLGISTPWQKLREQLICWFYRAFVQRLGVYLIELNSGRLRQGIDAYRAQVARHGPPGGDVSPELLVTQPSDDQRRTVGKSVGKVLDQTLAVGKKVFSAWWNSGKKPDQQ